MTSSAARVPEAQFSESLAAKISRWFLGLAYSCHPKRAAELPALMFNIARDGLRGGTQCPDASTNSLASNGFSGIARAVSPDTVLAAARNGYFLWCHIGPLKWWTRRERMVLKSGDFHMPKNTRRMLRNAKWRVSFDKDFNGVMRACAGQSAGRSYSLTWITPKIMRLYSELHRQGHAHSFEVWDTDGLLIGGGYGLSVGRVFIVESMFSLVKDTSKYGFAVLQYHLDQWGYVLTDGKDWASSLEDRGFALVPRADYDAVLRGHGQGPSPAVDWTATASLADVARWQPGHTVDATSAAAA